MPFPGNIRRRYALPEIKLLLPGQRGVYGIYNDDKWLYIGHSTDMRASLIEHWETDARLEALGPTGWTFEITKVERVRQTLLISELRPVLNARTAHVSV